jgi:small conductance mechanosensitive channel
MWMDWTRVTSLTENLGPRVLDWGITIVGAILLFIGGLAIASWAAKAANRLMSRSDRIDPAVRTFVASLVRYAVLFVTVLAILGKFGIQTASLVAILGALGLAIGLGLQGALSDVAAGLLLLVVRPFRIGDFIQVATTAEGSVGAITLFTTELTTIDNRQIVIPNSKVWGNTITNFTRHPTRRVDLRITIAHEANAAVALDTALKVLQATPGALSDPKPQASLDGVTDSGLVLFVRFWVNSSELIAARAAALLALEQAFKQAGISFSSGPKS